MWKTGTLGIFLLLLSVTASGAVDRDQWLHIAVDGVGHNAERVRVNLPLTLVEAVLPLIEESEFRHGKIVLDNEEFRRADIVEILRAVREAQEGEYVTIEDYEDHVRISKEEDYIVVEASEGGRHPSQVDIRVPVVVLDALVSGGSDELNILAAIEALGEHGDGDLITVNDDGETVRIWIDRENVSERGEDQ
jgi:hypothetical protein